MIHRIGKVIDNNDPDKLGKIQVQILPEFAQLDEALLPWISPTHTAQNHTTDQGVGTHRVPPIESYVNVEISSDWQSFSYGSTMQVANLHYPYPSFEENFNVPDVEIPEYPQPEFTKKDDGTIFFHNTETGEMGLQHSTGTYICIDVDGNPYVRSLNKLTMSQGADEEKTIETIFDAESKTVELAIEDTLTLTLNGDSKSVGVVVGDIDLQLDGDSPEVALTSGKVEALLDGSSGDVTIKGNNFTFDLTKLQIAGGGDNAVLFSVLEEILKELFNHNHTAPSGPTSPAQDASMVPLAGKLMAKLMQMKSQAVTLD